MDDFVPAPGARVTVDGVTWTWDKGVEAWEHEDLRLRAHDALFPYLTRIAELEAETTHLRARAAAAEAEVSRWINAALASTMPDEFGLAFDPNSPGAWAVSRRAVFERVLNERDAATARLARYAAIGKEAAEHVIREYPSNTLFNHAAQGVVDKLAAEYRAQEGR